MVRPLETPAAAPWELPSLSGLAALVGDVARPFPPNASAAEAVPKLPSSMPVWPPGAGTLQTRRCQTPSCCGVSAVATAQFFVTLCQYLFSSQWAMSLTAASRRRCTSRIRTQRRMPQSMWGTTRTVTMQYTVANCTSPPAAPATSTRSTSRFFKPSFFSSRALGSLQSPSLMAMSRNTMIFTGNAGAVQLYSTRLTSPDDTCGVMRTRRRQQPP
mmetsp:Transcript_125790/g.355688  ORF Transcript_125790/g.355688 Transcript_125790/m.355688 type:complete len:215 (+) Transcript_125790:1582-2226(+)